MHNSIDESSIRRGIDNNEFFIEYQPQIHLRSLKFAGAEALVRWDHPESGVIYPNVFLEIAEKTNLIIPLGEFVFI